MQVSIAAILLTGCVLTTAGCAGSNMVTVKTLESRNWVGRTQDELVRAWGEPAGEELDVQGRRVLVYRGLTREKTYFPAPEHRVPDESVPEGFVDIGAGPASRTSYARGVVARFHIDDQGIVREYWTHPTLRRMPLPPPRAD